MAGQDKEKLKERVEGALVNIRNFVEEDGGDMEVIEVTEDNIVRIELKGACTSCSMNNMTFRAGVEETILKAIPEIKGVEAANFELHNP